MAPPTEGVIGVHTVGQIIANALQDGGIVGVDEDIEPIVLNKAFLYFNWLLVDWQRHRWLDYSMTELSVVSTGATTYNIGQGQPFNINPRPERLEYAFLRFLNSGQPAQFPVDKEIDVIQSPEDYARITVKTIGTLPWRVFLDTQWPVGVLKFWPVPQAAIYELHIGFKTILARYTSPQQQINLPPEYEAAMNWCLARRLRQAFRLPESAEVNALARSALQAIRLANAQMGTLQMPSFLRQRNRSYDYRGDSDSF